MPAKKNTPKTTAPATNVPDDAMDILATLRITKKMGRPTGGTWVRGTIAGHDFEALVFPEHAESEAYEMGTSRISKFWLRDQTTNLVICEFDRGWSIRATTDAAKRITDLLAAGLAETVFGK